jgi:periplasmic protein TonB
MFESSMLPNSARRRAISLGYVIETLLLGLLGLFPLIHSEALPSALTSATYLPAPPPATPTQRSAIKKAARTPLRDLMAAPVTIPNRIVQLAEKPQVAIEPPAVGMPGSVPWGDARGLADAIGRAIPPPPPTRREPSVTRLHVGGAVEAARLVFQPEPEYPEIARMARVQGTVRLAALITKEGAIESVQVLSGPPLLVKAAMDAVARWRYQPTLLDGEPVEVSTEIDVNFVLGE